MKLTNFAFYKSRAFLEWNPIIMPPLQSKYLYNGQTLLVYELKKISNQIFEKIVYNYESCKFNFRFLILSKLIDYIKLRFRMSEIVLVNINTKNFCFHNTTIIKWRYKQIQYTRLLYCYTYFLFNRTLFYLL